MREVLIMNMTINKDIFQDINKGYNDVFKPNKLSIGLVVPIENYSTTPIPNMDNQVKRVQLAEQLGFSAVWLRDIPFNVPSFGDVGQVFDPWVYLGLLAGKTSTIALGVSSIILPLRHPAHVAKAAASIDVLSNGRLILGVASGDRPDEYPVLNFNYEKRGERFRENIAYIKTMWESFPTFNNTNGSSNGHTDLLPKPQNGRFPMLITGHSQQTPEWIAKNSDGWMIYPRNIVEQKHVIKSWKERVYQAERVAQPIMQPLYIDLADKPDTKPQPIHLGYKIGSQYLNDYLKKLEDIGVNHVALNLRFNQANIEKTLESLASSILSD